MPVNYNNSVPVQFLMECFDYDPDSGVLRWRVRPSSHFKTAAAEKCFNGLRAGVVAGSDSLVRGRGDIGYLKIGVTYGKQRVVMSVHRICWAIYYGEYPAEHVDHLNGDGKDNRICNLRSCSAGQNRRNSRISSLNKTGVSGVEYRPIKRLYRANCSGVFLGWHKDFFEAVCARKSAELRMGYTARHGVSK